MQANKTPRVYSQDEVREHFLTHVVALIQYWSELPGVGSPRQRLEGLAHSILVALDGCATALPGFVVAPAPHPSDRSFALGQGENWYPASPAVACDIAGHLHEKLYEYIRKAQSGV